MSEEKSPQICDYEGSDYRTEFWEGQGRDYEDQAERIAIRRLMPLSGNRLLELGAGFGRLSDLYTGYNQVVLLDYSLSQLEYARQHFGDDGFLYVAANIYRMPFAPALFDAATMIRVLHHMQHPEQALRAVRDVMIQNGSFLLEFANKQNIKAIVRWLFKRQDWNPFTREAVEFVELNYDFHPKYVRETLVGVDFLPGRVLTVSHFRMDIIKRLIPTGVLVALDSLAQLTGGLWQLSPSVFVHNVAAGADIQRPEDAFWCCPACRSIDMAETKTAVNCSGCGAEWPIINGVYNFKEQV